MADIQENKPIQGMTPPSVDKGETPPPVNKGTTASFEEKSPTASFREDVAGLKVSELDKIITVLEGINKQGKLNVRQQELLKAAQEQRAQTTTPTRNEKDVSVNNTDGDEPNKMDSDGKGPFKEEDVISYMYNDWLIGGANWLWAKTESKLKSSYYWAQNEINKARAQKLQEKLEKKNKKYDTVETHKKFDESVKNSNDAFLQKNARNQERTAKDLDLIAEGKMDQVKTSPATKLLLGVMDEKERKAFAEFAKERLRNLYTNLENAEIFAGNIAKAGMVLDMVKDPKGGQSKSDAQRKQEYEQRKRKLVLLFARAVHQAEKEGKNPQKVISKLIDQSNEIAKLADDNIFDLKFAENQQEPSSKSLKKYNEMVSDLQKYNTREAAQDMSLFERVLRDQHKEMDLRESAVHNQSFDQQVNENMNDSAAAYLTLMGRKEKNEDRRNNLNNLKRKLGITPEKEETLDNSARETVSTLNKRDLTHRMAETLGGLDR